MINEITYKKYGDYFLPDFSVPQHKPIGKYGIMYRNYIKTHRRTFYSTLLMTGKLNNYLCDIDRQANELKEILLSQYKSKYEITEKLKADNQMGWIHRMNIISYQIDEVIFDEIFQKTN